MRVWHVMLAGGIFFGLLFGIWNAIGALGQGTAFAQGVFLGSFISYGIISAAVISGIFMFLRWLFVPRHADAATPKFMSPRAFLMWCAIGAVLGGFGIVKEIVDHHWSFSSEAIARIIGGMIGGVMVVLIVMLIAAIARRVRATPSSVQHR